MAKLETLFDNFTGSRDASKWSQFATGTASIAQSGGQVTATIPSGTATASYGGYDGANTYDLTGSFGFIQVVGVPVTSTHAQAYFKVGFDSSNYVQFVEENGLLYIQKEIAGVLSNIAAPITYNSTTHAWWRIRELAGTIYYEYSSDGESWTNPVGWSVANPFVVTNIFVEFAGGNYQSETSPGTAIFDNFNTGVQTASPVTLNGDSDISAVARYIGNGLAAFAGDSDLRLQTPVIFAGDSDIALSAQYIPINVYGTQPGGFSVLINGTDRTGDVLAGSLTIDDLLYDQANVATFNMEILSGLPTPQNDQEVYVWLDGQLQFGGVIDAVKSQRVGGQLDMWEIDCVDFTRLLDKRLVNQTFTNMLDVDIVAAIINGYASDEGITMNNVTTDGIMVSQLSWNYLSPSNALSDLAKLTGRFWYIDYNKDLHYFPLLQNQTPFDITDDSNTFANLGTAKDTSQLRNRIFVQGGTELSDIFTESQKADGVQTTFLLAEKPHSITMTVNGVAKTIGIENIDDPTLVNFLLNYEQKYIKVGNAATPSNGDTLVFTYQYDVPVLVSLEDSASVAADGAYEYPIIDSTIVTTDAARDRATAELTDYAQTLVSVSYDTMIRNLRSGMYQNIVLTPQGINGDYIVSEVKMQSISGGLFVSTVTLTSAKVIGIIKFLIDMLNIDHTLGTFNPNAKVDGFAGVTDSLNPLSDSLVDSLGGSAAKWSNDPGTTTNKLRWNLSQWQ